MTSEREDGENDGMAWTWLDSEEVKVRCLVSEVFGTTMEESKPWKLGEGMRIYPLTMEDLERPVRRALGKTKNGSAPGTNGIIYRLNKAVREMWLRRELIQVVVDCFHTGVIPRPWREMRVVFIPKPGRDLKVVKN